MKQHNGVIATPHTEIVKNGKNYPNDGGALRARVPLFARELQAGSRNVYELAGDGNNTSGSHNGPDSAISCIWLDSGL
jgi:hypothetical protein